MKTRSNRTEQQFPISAAHLNFLGTLRETVMPGSHPQTFSWSWDRALLGYQGFFKKPDLKRRLLRVAKFESHWDISCVGLKQKHRAMKCPEIQFADSSAAAPLTPKPRRRLTPDTALVPPACPALSAQQVPGAPARHLGFCRPVLNRLSAALS